MFDSATLTICGNVVADPRVTGLGDSPDRVSFRVIANRRRRDPQTGQWVSAGEYGMNVVCWRKLARGVAQCIHKGDPVLVIGRMSERQYTGSDGQVHWHTEVTADFVGPDLSQGIAGRFTRFTQLDRLSERDLAVGEAGTGSADLTGSDGANEAEEPTDEIDFAASDDFVPADVDAFEVSEPEPAVF